MFPERFWNMCIFGTRDAVDLTLPVFKIAFRELPPWLVTASDGQRKSASLYRRLSAGRWLGSAGHGLYIKTPCLCFKKKSDSKLLPRNRHEVCAATGSVAVFEVCAGFIGPEGPKSFVEPRLTRYVAYWFFFHCVTHRNHQGIRVSPFRFNFRKYIDIILTSPCFPQIYIEDLLPIFWPRRAVRGTRPLWLKIDGELNSRVRRRVWPRWVDQTIHGVWD